MDAMHAKLVVCLVISIAEALSHRQSRMTMVRATTAATARLCQPGEPLRPRGHHARHRKRWMPRDCEELHRRQAVIRARMQSGKGGGPGCRARGRDQMGVHLRPNLNEPKGSKPASETNQGRLRFFFS